MSDAYTRREQFIVHVDIEVTSDHQRKKILEEVRRVLLGSVFLEGQSHGGWWKAYIAGVTPPEYDRKRISP